MHRSSITAWPSPDQKAAFAALARSRGLSQSKLMGLLIDAVLARSPVSDSAELPQAESAERDRITVRLRPDDGMLLRARARQRGMSYATYVAALIRAHLRADPPMPMQEVALLERTLAEVSSISRGLRELGRAGEAGHGSASMPLPELESVRAAVEDVRQALREVVRANRISWESADAEAAA